MQTVNVNQATAKQLRALLDLSFAETRSLIDARPVVTTDEFYQALPLRIARTRPSLEIAKIDINQVSKRAIESYADVSSTVADAILANRPYFFLVELRHLPEVGIDEFNRLASIYSTPDFSYTNKLTGLNVALRPELAEVLVSLRETEDASTFLQRQNLRERYAQSTEARYRVFSVPELETGTQTLVQLKRDPGVQKVFPLFRDEQGDRRYVDLEFCVVQFHLWVSESQQNKIMSDLDLDIFESHRTFGLFTLSVSNSLTDPGGLFSTLESLSNLNEVKFAEPLYLGFDDLEDALIAPPATTEQLAWNLTLIQCPEAWVYGEGSPEVIIAVIDTGVDENHVSLQGGTLQRPIGEDWNFESEPERVPIDAAGHGTGIAGILVGNGQLGVQGICPQCYVQPLKIPLVPGQASYARRRDAILYALDNIPSGKRLILSLSWKTTGDVALIRDAIEIAAAQDVVVVASAGNWPDRRNQPHYPSDYTSVISVGGVGPDLQRPEYSYYGDRIDIAAPGGAGTDDAAGSNILSSAPDDSTQTDFGTSFATPHVAGVAALVLSLDLSMSAADVREAVESSATPIGQPDLGRGLVNAAGAVARASPSMPSLNTISTPPCIKRLEAINNNDLETLIRCFGLSTMTALLLINRRPYTHIEDILGTLGLTNEQYTLIISDEGDEDLGPSASGYEKLDVNDASLDELKAVGIPAFTAQVIIARRPHNQLALLLDITGMTPELLERLMVN